MVNSQAHKPVVLINGKPFVSINGVDVPVASWKVSLNNICNTDKSYCTITPLTRAFAVRFKPRAHFIDMIRIAMVAKELRAMTRTMMMRRTRGNN